MSVFETAAGLAKSVFGNMSGQDKKYILKDSMILFAVFNAPFVPVMLIPVLEKCGYEVEIDPDRGIGVVKRIPSGKVLDRLRNLKKLVDEGILTDEDFEDIKQNVLRLKKSKDAEKTFDDARLAAYIEAKVERSAQDAVAIET